MVPWSAIVLPALLAAALVFLASSLLHMVLRWHNPDYWKLPNEDEVRAAIRKASPRPGQYIIPHCLDPKEATSAATKQKFDEGPVGVLYLRPNGMFKLGPFLVKWFAYSIVVGLLVGYIARATLPRGTAYLEVFRLVGTSAWLAYSWQDPSSSIWKGQPWSVTMRNMVDGLVYALLTAGTFAWLWPR